MKKSTLKSDSILTGVAGEYFVAAELTKRGYIASITLKNTKGIDVLVSNKNAKKLVGIQVKSTRYYNVNYWMLNEKAEKFYGDNLFYVFVNLKPEDQRPDFYIVPSKVVARYIKRSNRNWLKRLSKSGKKHKANPIRKFVDEKRNYLERWDLLKNNQNLVLQCDSVSLSRNKKYE